MTIREEVKSRLTDRGHVDGVVGDTDDGGEDHAADPVNGRALNRPGETKQADRQARSGVEEEPQSGLILSMFVFGFELALLDVALDGRNEEQPGKEVADADRNERQSDLDGGEVPLFVDQSEGLNEHEDERVGETREQRKCEHDGLGEEHAERTDPSQEDLLGREAVTEWDKLVRAPDVGVGFGEIGAGSNAGEVVEESRLRAALVGGVLAFLLQFGHQTTLAGNLIHQDGGASLGDGEEV